MPTLFFHDYEQTDLEGAVMLVKEHLDRLPDPDTKFEIFATTSRNELLDAISKAKPGSGIALIDLQRDNRTKGNFVGLRVLEAIRRHPTLAARCRPMALTRWDDQSVIDAVEEIGGYGLVRRFELQRTIATPGELGLASQLAAIAKTPCVLPDSLDVPFTVIPEQAEIPIDAPSHETDMLVVRDFFPDYPEKAKFSELEWAILRLYRETGDRGLVVAHVADTYIYSRQHVGRLVDRMRATAAAVYRTPQPDLPELANDLFAKVPHRRAAPPTAAGSTVELPIPLDAGRMCADTSLVKAAWIDENVVESILAVSKAWNDPGRRAGDTTAKTTMLERVAAIEQAVADASEQSGHHDVAYHYAYGTLQLLDAQHDALTHRY